ncbi:MAG: type II toxin-antitoxin system RelE/ParE family toxin [bacterium]
MRRVFKTRPFARWSSKNALPDTALCRAVAELEQGLVDADLGGSLFKKRVALAGRGKRGGARVIIATKQSGHWYLLAGYAKNDREKLTMEELVSLRELAGDLIAASDALLTTLITQGRVQEICHDRAEA